MTKSTGENLTSIFNYEYPEEPKANSKENVKLNGTSINDEKVVERESTTTAAHIRLVTERRGKGNDRDALIRYTYVIGVSSFSIKKEVQPEGSAKLFEGIVTSGKDDVSL